MRSLKLIVAFLLFFWINGAEVGNGVNYTMACTKIKPIGNDKKYCAVGKIKPSSYCCLKIGSSDPTCTYAENKTELKRILDKAKEDNEKVKCSSSHFIKLFNNCFFLILLYLLL